MTSADIPQIIQFQPTLLGEGWLLSRDGDPRVYAMYRRHYSAKGNNPKVRQFVGPGEKLVLYHASGLAVMAWRKGIFDDGQQGVNNAIFINRGAGLASQLILEAEPLVWARWPQDTRLFTYVNSRKIRSTNPGFCYLQAGWQRCGKTKGGLWILEKRR
jgi:hypothetical protein